MPDMNARAGSGIQTIAVIPVGTLEGAKSRLGETLDGEERRDLATRMARRTIESAVATPDIAEVLVVTPDPEVRDLALSAGARPVRQRSQGLNRGLREAREEALAAGAEALLILPIDLPLISSDALRPILATLEEPDRPLVVIVPDRHRRGTNALLLAPPDAIEFGFGGDSRTAHLECAREAGARIVELEGPLMLDLDTPEDLLLVEQKVPERVRAG
jgi:2-phospho-L-lactate guanylyltransferase